MVHDELEKTEALLFGYNPYALELLRVLSDYFESITLYSAEPSAKAELQMLYPSLVVRTFNLDDDWQELERNHQLDRSIIFAALDDDSKNIFLTISLRASFSLLHIVGYAGSQSAFKKLHLARATHVISKVASTVELICDTITNPYISKLRNSIYLQKEGVQIHEIAVRETPFVGETLHNIPLFETFELIVIAARLEDESHKVRFSNEAKAYVISENDTLIFLGTDENFSLLNEHIKANNG